MKQATFFLLVFFLFGCNSNIQNLSSLNQEVVGYEIVYDNQIPTRVIEDFETELQAILDNTFSSENVRLVPVGSEPETSEYRVLLNFKDWDFIDTSETVFVTKVEENSRYNPATKKQEVVKSTYQVEKRVNSSSSNYNLDISIYDVLTNEIFKKQESIDINNDIVFRDNRNQLTYTVEERAFLHSIRDLRLYLKRNLSEVLYEALVEKDYTSEVEKEENV